MSVRSTGLLSQHYQTERDAVIGIIFLFNFSENIMSYSQNSMLCDLSAWSSINLQLCHHRTSMYSTSVCDTTKQSVPQPEKKPPPKQKEAIFGIYNLTLLDHEEWNTDLRSSIKDKGFNLNGASESRYFCCSSFSPELVILETNKEIYIFETNIPLFF